MQKKSVCLSTGIKRQLDQVDKTNCWLNKSLNEGTDRKIREQSMNKSRKKKNISLAIKSDKKKNCLQPR